jgi:hypothetical protein
MPSPQQWTGRPPKNSGPTNVPDNFFFEGGGLFTYSMDHEGNTAGRLRQSVFWRFGNQLRVKLNRPMCYMSAYIAAHSFFPYLEKLGPADDVVLEDALKVGSALLCPYCKEKVTSLDASLDRINNAIRHTASSTLHPRSHCPPSSSRAQPKLCLRVCGHCAATASVVSGAMRR